MNSITLLSPAKINLYLKVINKKSDGYHNIVSIIQPVSIFDKVQINIRPGNEINLKTEGIHIPEGRFNTAYIAAKLFSQKSGIKRSFNITIKKNIPPGSGMGGGSSNAAAVLVGLNKIFCCLNDNELIEIATQIGADVPFFIRCTTSLVEGIGERITHLSGFPIFHYVVVHPGINASTQKIYQKWDDLEKNKPIKTIYQKEIMEIISRFKKEKPPLLNDLEPAAFNLYPRIFECKELLRSLGKKSALMTGSGSAVYSIFEEENEARIIYNNLRTLSNVDVFIAKGIQGWRKL